MSSVYLPKQYRNVPDNLQKMLKLKEKQKSKWKSMLDTFGLLVNFGALDSLYAGCESPPHISSRVLSRVMNSIVHLLQ